MESQIWCLFVALLAFIVHGGHGSPAWARRRAADGTENVADDDWSVNRFNVVSGRFQAEVEHRLKATEAFLQRRQEGLPLRFKKVFNKMCGRSS